MLCQSGQVRPFQLPGVSAVAMAPSWVPVFVNLGASCLEASRENRTILPLILAPSITQPLLGAPPKALQVDRSQDWGPDAVILHLRKLRPGFLAFHQVVYALTNRLYGTKALGSNPALVGIM